MYAASHTRGLQAASGVLVVDDEWVVRKVVARCLRDDGHEVWEASSGSEALRIAAKEGDGIGVALVDVHMDGMSGFESAVRLRVDHPRISIVYMTGDARAVNLQTRVPVLKKPFTPQELRVTVRVALEGEPPQAG